MTVPNGRQKTFKKTIRFIQQYLNNRANDHRYH